MRINNKSGPTVAVGIIQTASGKRQEASTGRRSTSDQRRLRVGRTFASPLHDSFDQPAVLVAPVPHAA